MAERFVLSNFGVHYFLEAYVDSNTIPQTGTNPIEMVLGSSIGPFSKDSKRYKTLDGDGWDSIAPLGQSLDDAVFDCVRGGTGDPYVGSNTQTSTYSEIRKWFMDSVASGGAFSPKCIVEVIPRGNNAYEGTVYYVIPKKWGPGKKDTEAGQEYSFEVSPFGKPVPVVVTHTVATELLPESWAFALPS